MDGCENDDDLKLQVVESERGRVPSGLGEERVYVLPAPKQLRLHNY